MCNARNHPDGCACGFGPPYLLDDPELFLRGVLAAHRLMQSCFGPEWPFFSSKLDAAAAKVRSAGSRRAARGAAARLLREGKGTPVGELLDEIARCSSSVSAMRALLDDAPRLRRLCHAHAVGPMMVDLSGLPGGLPPTEADTLLGVVRGAPPPRSAVAAPPPPPTHGPGPGSATPRRLGVPPEAALVTMAEPPEFQDDVGVTAVARPEPRFTNLRFHGGDDRPVPTSAPLTAGASYELSVDIGPLAHDSIVRNAEANPVRGDLLPASADGHWLKVVAMSRDLEVAPTGRWLFLPTTGAAWSCRCRPGGGHACRPSGRRPDLRFPVRAPPDPGQSELRVTIYYERSVVQSLLVTATVVRTAGEPGGNSAVVDYNLTNALTDLEEVSPRAFSVMMNDARDATHTLVLNGVPDDGVPLQITDGQMTDALRTTREVLRRIHIEDPVPPGTQPRNRYDADNRKPREAFIADLRELAVWGWSLWNTLLQEHVSWWKRDGARFAAQNDVIHIARKKGSTTIFPWALVYDIPIETGAPQGNRLCRLLEEPEWERFRAGTGEVPRRCPHEQSHGDDGVICPYGFWGYRYEIEQPPSLESGRSLRREIPTEPQPLDILVALSDELDAGLRDAHLDVLARQLRRFRFHRCHCRNDIRDALARLDPEVVYFYCHGCSRPLPGGTGTAPTLGVGTGETIAPPDLTTWSFRWPPAHWEATAPLVFINGCHTADTTPQTLVNFVDTFSAALHAAGVIGTEITLHQRIANEIAETMLDAFQRGVTVGRALRAARTRLLRKGNLLGLVYTAYCSADLKLSASVI